MIYGDFIGCFPELQEQAEVWNDETDIHTLPIIYLPDKGSVIKRRKYTSGNTALDLEDDDYIYVHKNYISQISEGDYLRRADKIIWRVIGKLDYSIPADYACYVIARVTGATPDHIEDLIVKEGSFD